MIGTRLIFTDASTKVLDDRRGTPVFLLVLHFRLYDAMGFIGTSYTREQKLKAYGIAWEEIGQ